MVVLHRPAVITPIAAATARHPWQLVRMMMRCRWVIAPIHVGMLRVDSWAGGGSVLVVVMVVLLLLSISSTCFRCARRGD